MFARFPPPPTSREVTVAERNCTLLSEALDPVDENVSKNTSYQPTGRTGNKRYCEHLVKDEGRHSGGGVASAFLERDVEDNHWKVAWTTWRKDGWWSALRSLHECSERDGGVAASSLPVRMASSVVSWVDAMDVVLSSLIAPRHQLSVEEAVTKYSSHPNWCDSAVRAIALHPRLDYVALATQRDVLEIRSTIQKEDQKILLRDRQQVGVACMEWAPHCDSLLAVGAEPGVLLWHVDPTSPSTRFVTSWVRVESSPGHSPVTSLSWSPWGNLLISASPREPRLVVWDVPMGVATHVQRGRGKGVALVSWSPDGCRVLAGGVSAVFRVWETNSWTNECWADFAGRCKCACWGPKGQLLLFALEGDPSLYYISFHGSETGSNTAIKCADLSPHAVQDDGRSGTDTVVGGSVQDMVWDTTGHRLAIIFTPDSEGCELVALFRTHVGHFLLDLLPVGFVRGLEEERPEIIKFKRNMDTGALLAVASNKEKRDEIAQVWSSGRLSFLPLYFSDDPSLSSVPRHTLSVSHAPPPHSFTMDSSLARTPLNGRSSLLTSDDYTSVKLYSTHK